MRVRGLRAEAIRTNVQYAPRFGPIEARAGAAMATVSGCKVVEVTGDQALALGRLDCGSGPPPKRIKTRAVECAPIRGTEIEALGEISVELDCAAI